MATAAQRIAELERQVAGLTAAVEELRAETFANTMITEKVIRIQLGDPSPALPGRRPRHLHSVLSSETTS